MALMDCKSGDKGILHRLWLPLFIFAAIWFAMRAPWLPCDPGIPSAWEYGYNATDEGYYLSGGKEKLLWGHFVDLPRTEAFTYGYSAGTHWLSYLSHLAFGLSTWTWRIPFFLIYMIAWIAMFCHLAKRAGPWTSFALCTAVSMIPMVVAYERTASNDAAIGAVVVLSYVLAAGRTRWRIVAAGLLAGTIVLVKPSVWALLPLVAAGVVGERPFRDSVRDLALFVAVAVAAVFAYKALVMLSVMPDAARAGVSAREIVKQTTTHYALPPIFDFASHFRGFASFPRDPSIQLLGVVAPLVSAVPFALAVRTAFFRRWNGNLLLFLAIPAYVAAVSVMNTIYTHYFLPVLCLLPIMLSASAEELSFGTGKDGADRRKMILVAALTTGVCLVGMLFLAGISVSPAESQHFYSRIYNLPSRNVWGLTWPQMLVFACAATFGIAAARGFRFPRALLAVWFLLALVAASVVFAAFPATVLAPHMKQPSAAYFAPMAVSLVFVAVFLVFTFGYGDRLPWRRIVRIAVPAFFLACAIATPSWRNAFCELVRPGTHHHDEAAAELKALLPENAIVIGERSNQMLMSLPFRTAATCAANSDPIPVIESILKAEPDAKLYALADSQHAYNLQHYREHAKEYSLRPIKVFKMPSFGTGKPADVYLCEIHKLGNSAQSSKNGP